MSGEEELAALLQAVDSQVESGNLAQAAHMLDAALAASDHGPAVWLRLAGLRRALRQPHRALDAVHRTLAHNPLDFVALCLRAALLEKLDPTNAGQAWSEALAQRPADRLPAGMVATIAHGEALRDAWVAERSVQLAAATAPAAASADNDAAWKIERFRTNVLRETKVWHSSPTHYHYPGLIEREFHPRQLFPWLDRLEAATDVIRTEMQAALATTRADLVPYITYAEHEALDQWRPLNRNRDWTAAHLLQKGAAVEANAVLCPQTMQILRELPQPVIAGASPNAMFSLLAPHTEIPPHVGVNNARLVCHLPLVVPEGCWFRVGGETRMWREGKAFVFDDTIEHEAMNPTDQLRVVLIFDVWHPQLGPAEQLAIAALIAADGGQGDGL